MAIARTKSAKTPAARKTASAGRWIKELEGAEKDKDFKKFRERGRKVVRRYMGELDDALISTEVAKYNVFWANVGLLKAALYANSPKPVVKREFNDFKDQVGRVASVMMERLLSQPFEDQGSYMNITFRQVVEDRLVPGLGQVWLRYTPKFRDLGVPDAEGNPQQELIDEEVDADYVHWEDFFFSPCRTWAECRWAARRVWLDKEDFTKRFGKALADLVEWKLKGSDKLGDQVSPESFLVKKTEVFELWCKDKRKVYFFSKSYSQLLDEVDDPLELRDFFPCPCPLLATHTTSSLVPKADYMMAQSQYTRLQDLTIRIKMLEDAIQASGVYDKSNNEMSQLLNGSKMNRMIAVDNWALFSEKGGIKGVVDWFPLEMIVNALDKLRDLKAEAKAELYELTGISDIMRGVSAPRETARAQDLKAQYSSVRLQYIQEEVAAFVQAVLRIKAEIIAKHFQPEIIIRNSLIMLTPDAQLAQQAVQVIKHDWQRMYRVQIYADTLSIPDYNAERAGRVEFITATGQFISQVIPLIQHTPAAASFLIQILQWGVASFRSAQSIEGTFTQMLVQLDQASKQPPKQPPPDPKLMKTMAEIQAMKYKTKATVEDMQTRTQAKAQTDIIQAQSEQQQMEVSNRAQMVTAVTKAVIAALEAEGRMQKQEKNDG